VIPFKFLTNHGLALLCIADDPETRIRDIAHDLEITERAAQRIVGDLVRSGYLTRARVGRRNRYALVKHLPVSLPMRRVVTLSSLLAALSESRASGPAPSSIDVAVR
jgi:DNA-binding MarR family transcriptional regulator